MTFHHDAPNSHVPGFLGFLVNALSATSHSESAKHACSHTKSSENFLYLLLSNTYLIWLLTAVDSKCNTNLEIYNTNVV